MLFGRTQNSLYALVFVSLAAIAMASPPASAATVDFESGTGYDLFFGAVLSTAQSHSATHSVELPMSSVDDTPLVREVPTSGTLRQTTGSFWSYVPSSSPSGFAPYMYFGVDTDQNGAWDPGDPGDSLIIASSGGAIPATIPQDQWFQTGLNGATSVHVEDDRSGLTAGTYTVSSGDTLSSLLNQTLADGVTKWGDLNVFRIYIAAGQWPGVSTYDAFVDDETVTVSVPEPTSLGLLGLGAMAVMSRRRRSR
jgi:hypothetical protein